MVVSLLVLVCSLLCSLLVLAFGFRGSFTTDACAERIRRNRNVPAIAHVAYSWLRSSRYTTLLPGRARTMSVVSVIQAGHRRGFCAGLSAHTDRPRGIVERWRSMMSHYLAARHERQSKGQSPRGTGHVALALSGGRVCVCLSLWLLLSVGSQGRNPNPAGTLIPCLALGPVWVTGWLYGDAVGHVRARIWIWPDSRSNVRVRSICHLATTGRPGSL